MMALFSHPFPPRRSLVALKMGARLSRKKFRITFDNPFSNVKKGDWYEKHESTTASG
jgi:hypothetical protein